MDVGRNEYNSDVPTSRASIPDVPSKNLGLGFHSDVPSSGFGLSRNSRPENNNPAIERGEFKSGSGTRRSRKKSKKTPPYRQSPSKPASKNLSVSPREVPSKKHRSR